MIKVTKVLVLAALLGLATTGCEEEPMVVGRSTTPAPPPAGEGAPGAPIAEADAGVDAGPEGASYRDEDFAESDTNRDPFRSFESMFVVDPPELDRGGRDVTMPDTGIDQMRLIGVVTGFANPRAMIIDSEGVGHVVRRGDYIGRSEVVQVGGTEQLPVTLNWRVDRIRDAEIVLIREDPTAPNRPPLTRVLTLRDEDEERALGGMGIRQAQTESTED
ncbi:MAG: pilus assembly protein PilP [Sandaracinaceae bacterium]|nr:pilus assembly protein PilP [Sandaracinaceae bacterium]